MAGFAAANNKHTSMSIILFNINYDSVNSNSYQQSNTNHSITAENLALGSKLVMNDKTKTAY